MFTNAYFSPSWNFGCGCAGAGAGAGFCVAGAGGAGAGAAGFCVPAAGACAYVSPAASVMLEARMMASSLINFGPFVATSRPTILLDRLTTSKMVSMLRSFTFRALLLLAPLVAACGDDNTPNGPSTPTPVAVTEQFSSTLTPNGGITHQFNVLQAGSVTVRLSALAPDDTVVIGLNLGTWNGQICAATLPNDKAALNTVVTGTAQNTGVYCARIYDAAGTLTSATDYTIDVTHF